MGMDYNYDFVIYWNCTRCCFNRYWKYCSNIQLNHKCNSTILSLQATCQGILRQDGHYSHSLNQQETSIAVIFQQPPTSASRKCKVCFPSSGSMRKELKPAKQHSRIVYRGDIYTSIPTVSIMFTVDKNLGLSAHISLSQQFRYLSYLVFSICSFFHMIFSWGIFFDETSKTSGARSDQWQYCICICLPTSLQNVQTTVEGRIRITYLVDNYYRSLISNAILSKQ